MVPFKVSHVLLHNLGECISRLAVYVLPQAMIFDEAKKEAEAKVKLLSKKLQASGLTLSDARVILDRLIKDHGDEVPPLGR